MTESRRSVPQARFILARIKRRYEARRRTRRRSKQERKERWSKLMKILVIRFSSLGDTILTTGVLKRLYNEVNGELSGGIDIDILTYAEFAEVWCGLPFINAVYAIPRGMKLKKYLKMLSQMPDYDKIFDIHDNLRSRIARKIIGGKAYTYRKNGLIRRIYVKFPSLRKSLRNKLRRHTVEKYAEPMFYAFDKDMPAVKELKPFLGEANITKRGKVVIHPFASKATKVWPRFPQVAKQLVDAGKDVYIVGQGDFAPIAGVTVIPPNSLQELFDIIKDAELVITTDSGPLHIATGFDRSVIAIFGSTSRELGFYPVFDKCYIVEKMLGCRPCDVHGLNACPEGHFACMASISVDAVMEKVWMILK